MIVRTLVVAVTLTAVALALFALERSRQLDAGVDRTSRSPAPRRPPSPGAVSSRRSTC